MRPAFKYYAVASVAVLGILSACGSDTNKPGGSAGGTAGTIGTGTGGKTGGGGGEGGGFGIGGTGVTGEAGDAGEAGETGMGTGGSSGVGTGTAGTGTGGHSGTAGTGTGGSGNAAGQSGSGGTAGQAGATNLGLILGPVTDNQLPVTVGVAHSGFSITSTFPVFLSDASGNLFTVGGSQFNAGALTLRKYSPTLAAVWTFTFNSIPGFTIDANSLSIAPDGGVFFGGAVSAALPGEAFAGGGSDAVVGKLTSAGALAWIHQWGSSSAESTTLTAVTSTGAVIAGGGSTGQAPGNPSTAAGGPWVARYEADGTRTFLKQYVSQVLVGVGISGSAIFIEASGNATWVGGAVLKVDTQTGTELPRTTPLAVPTNPTFFVNPSSLNPAKDTLYTWGSLYNTTGEVDIGFGQYDLNVTLLSYRINERPRSAVIEPVENVIWHGTFSGARPALGYRVAVGTDAVYLTGTYANSYMNGAIARPTTNTMFVGRYDLSGARVWFQELVFQGDIANTLQSTLSGILLDQAGNPVLAVSRPGTTVGFIFKLNAADGTIL